MSMEQQNSMPSVLNKPLTGTVLAVSSGLSFFFLCMILPLVGPAGSKTDHAATNRLAFLGVLMLTLLLAALASFSKMARRKSEGGPLPVWSLALCLVCVLTLFVFLLDGFSI